MSASKAVSAVTRVGVCALIFVLLAPIAGATSTTTTTIDANHPLASDSSVKQFEQTGNVSATLDVPRLTISVSTSTGQFSFDDTGQVYVTLDYNEEIPRKIRVYFPVGYFGAVEQFGTTPVSGEKPKADFEIAKNGKYTAVTVEFSGKTEVTYSVSKAASIGFSSALRYEKLLENLTNTDVNAVASNEKWKYVPQNKISGANSTYVLKRKGAVLIEYDRNPGTEEQTWSAVPKCSSTSLTKAPVCKMTKSGAPNRVYLISSDVTPPKVRYKKKVGFVDKLSGAVRVIKGLPDFVGDLLKGL